MPLPVRCTEASRDSAFLAHELDGASGSVLGVMGVCSNTIFCVSIRVSAFPDIWAQTLVALVVGSFPFLMPFIYFRNGCNDASSSDFVRRVLEVVDL